MCVHVADGPDEDEDEDDPWPDPLIINSASGTGITVLEFVKAAGAYMKRFENKLMKNYVYLTPKVEPEEIHLTQFRLIPDQEDGIYYVSLTLGEGREYPHLFFSNHVITQPSWSPFAFNISEQDEPDPEVRNALVHKHLVDTMQRLGAENRDQLRIARQGENGGLSVQVYNITSL
jgi:hypothetical protein